MYREAAIYAAIIFWYLFIRPIWPWDYSGRKKEIQVNNRKRDWDE